MHRCWRISPESRSGTVRRVNPWTVEPARMPRTARTVGSWPTSTASRTTGTARCAATGNHPPCSSPVRPRARAEQRPPTSDRSTVPATPRCTSTSGSSRSSRIGSGRRGDRSRRRTSWRTSTATTSRICSGCSPRRRRWAGTAERLRPHRAAGRLLCRRLGGERRRHRLPHADHRSGRRRRARRGQGGRRRPDPTRDPGQRQPRHVDARIVSGTPAVVPDGLLLRRSERVRHVQRFGLTRVAFVQLRPLLLRTRSTTQRIVSTNDARASSVESFASVMSG